MNRNKTKTWKVFRTRSKELQETSEHSYTLELSKIFWLMLFIRRITGSILGICAVVLDRRAHEENLLTDKCPDFQKEVSYVLVSSFCNNQKDIDQVIRISNAFQAQGFTVVIANNGVVHLREDVKNIIWLRRRNLGRDFAAWKDLINGSNLAKVSELVLINDSCFWTENSLSNFISYARESSLGICCATISSQKKVHMQSYIMYLKGDSIHDLASFFKSVKNWRFKRTIIKKGELALSEYLIEKGNYFDSWVKAPQRGYVKVLKKKIYVPINPIDYYSESVADKYGFYKKRFSYFSECND
jgi:hypothetical protein